MYPREMRRELAALALFAAAGCDKDEAPTKPPPEPAPSAVLAEGAVAATDPERPAGDLRADLDAFTTREECVSKRTRTMDPLVGDGLGAIGYDTFLGDACRMLEAAKTGEPKRCEAIDASPMRAKCRALVAIVSGRADDCPMRGDDPRQGREPSCVAAALRSPAMCGAETPLSRAACEAVVTHDAKKCEALVGADRDACARDAARYRSVVSGDAKIAKVAKASGELEVHGAGRDDPAETKVDLGPDMEPGAVVVLGAKESRFDMGTFGASAAVRTVAPHARTRLALTVHVLGDGSAAVERLELSVPGAPAAACAPCDGVTAKVVTLDKTRGGEVALSVEGSAGNAPNAFRLKARLATFVRDVVQR